MKARVEVETLVAVATEPATAPTKAAAPPSQVASRVDVGRRGNARDLQVAVAVALAAKLVVLASTYLVLGKPDDFVHRLAWQWDGTHYLNAARDGYRTEFSAPGTSVSFALLYPTIVRFLGATPGAALAVSNVCSLLAVAVVARHWGRRPALALALFPPWVVFGTVAYSEGLYVLLAATALMLLERGRQAVGGIAAGFAAAARYFGGPALLLATVPWRTWRRPRDWLAFGIVAAAGLLLWAYLWRLTGTVEGYWAAQRYDGATRGWPWEHFTYLLHGWYTNQGGPVAPWGNMLPIEFLVRDLLYTIAVGAGLVLLWRRRGPLPSLVYCTVAFVTAYCIIGIPATALPRYLLAAFPAIAALGLQLQGRLAWTAYAGLGLTLALDGMCRHLFWYWS